MGLRKLRLLGGSTSMDIIGLKHESANQIKRLTRSPCDQRWMQKKEKNWLYSQPHPGGTDRLKAHPGSEHTCPWSNPIRPITERIFKELFDHHSIQKKKGEKKETAERSWPAVWAWGKFVWEERGRGVDLWYFWLLLWDCDWLWELIRGYVGNVSECYAKSISTGLRQFPTFVF